MKKKIIIPIGFVAFITSASIALSGVETLSPRPLTAAHYPQPNVLQRIEHLPNNGAVYQISNWEILPKTPHREFLETLQEHGIDNIAVSGGTSRDIIFFLLNRGRHAADEFVPAYSPNDLDFTVIVDLSEWEKEWIWNPHHFSTQDAEVIFGAILGKTKKALEPLARLLKINVDAFLSPRRRRYPEFGKVKLQFMGIGGIPLGHLAKQKDQDNTRKSLNIHLIDQSSQTLVWRRPEFSINSICILGSGRVIDSYEGVKDLEERYIRFLLPKGFVSHLSYRELFRLVRFLLQYDLSLDSSTQQAAVGLIERLQHPHGRFSRKYSYKSIRKWVQTYEKMIQHSADERTVDQKLREISGVGLIELEELLRQAGFDVHETRFSYSVGRIRYFIGIFLSKFHKWRRSSVTQLDKSL